MAATPPPPHNQPRPGFSDPQDATGGHGVSAPGNRPDHQTNHQTNQQPPAGQPGMDRRTRVERRTPGSEQNWTGLERRRGPGRRLSDMRKSAEQGELTKEQFLFLMAIDSFKKANDTAFPTWTDVLEVVRLLGYRKVRKSELNLASAEDWSEPFDAPSNVRPDRWAAWKRIDRERRAA